jgi:hypothetical protein
MYFEPYHVGSVAHIQCHYSVVRTQGGDSVWRATDLIKGAHLGGRVCVWRDIVGKLWRQPATYIYYTAINSSWCELR